MGGRLTAVVVGATVLLVVLGVVDALRGGGDSGERRAATTTAREERTTPRTVEERLEAEGVRGFMLVAVRAGADCRIDVLSLPALRRSTTLDGVACRIRVSPSGLVAAGPSCGRKDPRIHAQTGVGVRVLRGCAPAWRPNGRLTWVSPAGDVVELVEPCASERPCLRVVVDRSEPPLPILDLAWHGSERVAALHEDRRRNALLSIFRAGRLNTTEPLFRPLRPYIRLVGGLLLVPAGDPSGEILAFDGSARLVTRQALPGSIADGMGFTFSTADGWIASTAGDRVAVYEPGARGPGDAVFLDVNAEDLGAFGN